MFFKKCGKPMTIRNYFSTIRKTHKTRNPLSPIPPCNILISGHTGCGKTNLLLNLIYDLMYWDRLYIYAKDLQEPLYQELMENCEKADEIHSFEYDFQNDLTEVHSVDEMDRSLHNLIVFDDFCTDGPAMKTIKDFFIRGRKKNCTCIFISQDYFCVPKIIRLQCNYFCFFKSRDDREISDIYKTHSCGLTKEEFKKVYQEATSDNYNFLLLDKTQPSNDPKALRKNFDSVLNK